LHCALSDCEAQHGPCCPEVRENYAYSDPLAPIVSMHQAWALHVPIDVEEGDAALDRTNGTSGFDLDASFRLASGEACSREGPSFCTSGVKLAGEEAKVCHLSGRDEKQAPSWCSAHIQLETSPTSTAATGIPIRGGSASVWMK
jgi:hypothetical protein